MKYKITADTGYKKEQILKEIPLNFYLLILITAIIQISTQRSTGAS